METVLSYTVFLYLAVGLVFAVFFAWNGVGRLDAFARTSGLGFRLALMPGAMALWPYLLWRWLRRKAIGDKSRHLRLAELAHYHDGDFDS